MASRSVTFDDKDSRLEYNGLWKNAMWNASSLQQNGTLKFSDDPNANMAFVSIATILILNAVLTTEQLSGLSHFLVSTQTSILTLPRTVLTIFDCRSTCYCILLLRNAPIAWRALSNMH